MKDDQMPTKENLEQQEALDNKNPMNCNCAKKLESEIAELKDTLEFRDNEIEELESDFLKNKQTIRDLKAQLANSIPKELINKLLDVCDGLNCAYNDRNYGDAEAYLRHISAAYSDYQEALEGDLSSQPTNQDEEYSLTKSCGFDLDFIKGDE